MTKIQPSLAWALSAGPAVLFLLPEQYMGLQSKVLISASWALSALFVEFATAKGAGLHWSGTQRIAISVTTRLAIAFSVVISLFSAELLFLN